MKAILIIIYIFVFLTFHTTAEAPTFYYSKDCCIMKIENDTMYARNYGITLEFASISLEDTLGVFTLHPCGDSLYHVIQIFDNENDPFRNMHTEFHYTDKDTTDSISIRIHLPEIWNNGRAFIKINTPGSRYHAYNKDLVYETKVQKNTSMISCELMPQNLEVGIGKNPITQQGTCIGKLKLQSPTISLENSDSSLIDALDIYIPNLEKNVFYKLYVPDSYININEDYATWLGQKMYRFDSYISNPNH